MILKNCFDKLVKITEGCRHDMHEPDEQGVYAIITGDHLDNAFGDVESQAREYIVRISRVTSLGEEVEHFNLANLIALARMDKKTP